MPDWEGYDPIMHLADHFVCQLAYKDGGPHPYIPEDYAFTKIVKHAQATSPKAITVPSTEVLEQDRELHKIQLCDRMWDRFMSYCGPRLPTREGGRQLDIGNFNRNTLQLSNGVPEGDAKNNAALALSLFLKTMEARPKEKAASNQREASGIMAGEVQELLNIVFKMRYRGRLPAAEVVEQQVNPVNPVDGQQPPLVAGRPRNVDLVYPKWRANVRDDNPDGISGISDLVLESGRYLSASIFFKTPWVYTQKMLDNVFIHGCLNFMGADGIYFHSQHDGKFMNEYHMVAQAWGNMVLMGPKYLMWSNGQYVWLAVRDATRLICCNRMPWNETDTVRAVIGFSLMANDDAEWLEVHQVNIILEVAPLDERRDIPNVVGPDAQAAPRNLRPRHAQGN